MYAIKRSSPEIATAPDGLFFQPSELLQAVDEVFAARLGVAESGPHQPTHLGAIACKVVADCNLRCNGAGYTCYEYADPNWQDQPERMSDETIRSIGAAAGEYTAQHGLATMDFVLHGGEPLFTPDAAGYYDKFISLLESSALENNPGLTLRYGMQTNATFLIPKNLDMLKRHNIQVSCSVDGTEEAHNRNRTTKGRMLGSFMHVDRGIRRLGTPEYRGQMAGLLAVIDLRNDPLETYQALCSYVPPEMAGQVAIDFMLPYQNWDNPPHIPEDNHSPTPYADWLLTIFHQWWGDQQEGKSVPNIRLFRSILNLSRGGNSLTEAIGPLTSRIAFVRPDGTIEGIDAYKLISSTQNKTGIHIAENQSLEKAATHLRSTNQLGRKSLSLTCQNCALKDICGGGHLESRYSSQNGFDNTSVFCQDLKRLIKEIVSTANARYRDEMATTLAQPFRSAVPLSHYPKHTPFTPPPPLSLATHIRPATFSDVVAITDVHGVAYLEEYQNILDPRLLEEFIEKDLLPRKFNDWRHQIDTIPLFVATLGRKIVGFTALEPTGHGRRALLQAHYIHPEAKDYGVDVELLQEAERSLRDPADILLRATKRSAQAEFFRGQGYQRFPLPVASPVLLDQVPLPQVAMVRRANSRGAKAIRTLRAAGISDIA